MKTMRQLQRCLVPVMDRPKPKFRYYSAGWPRRNTPEWRGARVWEEEVIELLWTAQRLLGDLDCFVSNRTSVHLSKWYWSNGWA